MCVCVCVVVWARGTDFSFGISTFPFPPWVSLSRHPGLFIFPSYPKHGNAPRCSDLASCPDACTHTDPREPMCTLDLGFSPSSSLKPPSSSASLFCLVLSLSLSRSAFVLWETLRGCVEILVKCPVPCMTSSAVVLCHSAWGLSLKPKAALEEASDGFCPLFHSLAFIPLCSNRHQGRFSNKHVI